MDLKTLRAELQKLSALADGWDATHEIADIERDLALGKLRELYDAVRFGLASATQPPAEEPLPDDLPPVEIDLDAVIGLTAVADPVEMIPSEMPMEQAGAAVPVSEPIFVEEPAEPFAEVAGVIPVDERTNAPAEVPIEPPVVSAGTESVTETTEEAGAASGLSGGAVSAEPVAEAEPLSLFELDPVDVKRAKHRVVLSLYSDTEPIESVGPVSGKAAVEPVAEETEMLVSQSVPVASPAEEPVGIPIDAPIEGPATAGHAAVPVENGSAVLGETLNSNVKTVSDIIAVTAPAVAVGQEPVADLRKALCNNDRFLLAHDLFGGDMAACERTIDRLNEFGDLDECMIYIAENFDWNPNSDGAKLLVDLIERKFA